MSMDMMVDNVAEKLGPLIIENVTSTVETIVESITPAMKNAVADETNFWHPYYQLRDQRYCIEPVVLKV